MHPWRRRRSWTPGECSRLARRGWDEVVGPILTDRDGIGAVDQLGRHDLDLMFGALMVSNMALLRLLDLVAEDDEARAVLIDELRRAVDAIASVTDNDAAMDQHLTGGT